MPELKKRTGRSTRNVTRGAEILNLITISREVEKLGQPLTGLYIRKAVRKTLSAEKIEYPCEVSVVLTDNDGIQSVNREFRGVDSATDVLSFPQAELVPGKFNIEDCVVDPRTGRVILGDMMISVPRCEEQGIEFGHGYRREVMYLAVHSVLHLLGYDHVDEGEMKKQMRAREKSIMGDD